MYYFCFVVVGGAIRRPLPKDTRPSEVYLKVLEDLSYHHEEVAFRYLSGRFNR